MHKVFNDLKADFRRYFPPGKVNILLLIPVMFHNPGMIFSVCYRVEKYLLLHRFIVLRGVGWLLYPAYFFISYYLLSYHIEPWVSISGGLYLHNRDIVITDNTIIGKNFSCMGQVTIGTDFFNSGVITIGDNVWVGSGAKIIAKKDINISNAVLIGANSVIIKSIFQPNTSWGGNPARLLKKKLNQ